MRVLVVSSEYPPSRSGHARTAFELVRGFANHGESAEVLTSGNGCRRIGRVPYLDSVGKSIVNRGWDMVQVIGPSPVFTEQVVYECHRCEVPVVYTVSAMAGLSTYYHSAVTEVLDTVYERMVFRAALGKATHLVSNTETFAKASDLPTNKCTVIRHGTAKKDFPSDSWGRPTWDMGARRDDRQGRILFVGQLRPYKGLEVLFHSVQRLIQELPVECRVTIVGNGPERQRLVQLSKDLGVDRVVDWLGPVDAAILQKVYDSNDVLVLPSIYGESFGLVQVEARARGLTPVASNLPGVGQLALELGGITFAAGDSDALSDALRHALEQDGPGRPAFPADEYTWDRAVDSYLALYAKLLARGGS